MLVTSHGKPVARILPAVESDRTAAASARAALFARLRGERIVHVGRRKRDDLYERDL